MTTKKWYGSALPRMYNSEFAQFLGNAAVLVSHVFQTLKEPGDTYPLSGVRFTEQDHSSVTNQMLLVPRHVFDVTDTATTTALFNHHVMVGAAIEIMDNQNTPTPNTITNSRLYNTARGIIHQVYALQVLSKMGPFVNEALELYPPPDDPILAWNHLNQDVPGLPEEIQNVLERALLATTSMRRRKLAVELAALLPDDQEPQADQKPEEKSEEENGDSENAPEQPNEKDSEETAKDNPLSEDSEETGETPEEESGDVQEEDLPETLSTEQFEALMEEISDTIQREMAIRVPDDPQLSKKHPVVEIDALTLDGSAALKILQGAHEPDRKFRKFGDYLQEVVAPRPYLGEAIDYGIRPTLSGIWRVVHDNKVFNDTEYQDQRDPVELMLLLDASGSMGLHFWHEVLCAAWGIFESVLTTHITIGVYAHTVAIQKSTYCIAIYRIAHTPDKLIARRFTHAMGIDQHNNHDGHAVAYVAGKFQTEASKKILLVLSDGRPQGDGYRGLPALQHTRRTVEKLRHEGIKVYAGSLKKGCAPTQDNIYGAEYNIPMWGDIPRALKDFVRHINDSSLVTPQRDFRAG